VDLVSDSTAKGSWVVFCRQRDYYRAVVGHFGSGFMWRASWTVVLPSCWRAPVRARRGPGCRAAHRGTVVAQKPQQQQQQQQQSRRRVIADRPAVIVVTTIRWFTVP